MKEPKHPLLIGSGQSASQESNHRDILVIRALQPGPHQTDLINDMILANIPLVFLKVGSYIDLHSSATHLKEEMTNEGSLALTLAVQKLAAMGTPSDGGNPTGFVGQRIIWAISRVAEKDAKQKFPAEAIKEDIPLDPCANIETLDMLEVACHTPEDVILIHARLRGSTNQEIADILGTTKTAVSLQCQDIRDRFEMLQRDAQ